MNKENKLTLIIGLIFPATFYFFWYLFQLNNWEWQQQWDNIGLVVLMFSNPWSSIAYDLQTILFLNTLVNEPYSYYLISVFVCFAFSINLFIVKSLLKWLYGKIKNT